jgi:hypothetical protein
MTATRLLRPSAIAAWGDFSWARRCSVAATSSRPTLTKAAASAPTDRAGQRAWLAGFGRQSRAKQGDEERFKRRMVSRAARYACIWDASRGSARLEAWVERSLLLRGSECAMTLILIPRCCSKGGALAAGFVRARLNG